MYTFAITQRDLGEENSTCLNLSKILSFKLDTEGKKIPFWIDSIFQTCGYSGPLLPTERSSLNLIKQNRLNCYN